MQEKDSLIPSNAIVSQINMLANLIGPVSAGLFYSVAGKADLQHVRIIFLVCAICFFSAAVLEAFIKIPNITLPPISTPLYAVKKGLGESFYFLTSKQVYVFKAILLNAVFVLLIQPLITTGAPFIIRVVLNLSAVFNGLSQAFMGAAGLIGGIIAGAPANEFKADRIYWLFWIMGLSIAAFGGILLFNLSASLTYIIFVSIGIIIFISASMAGIFIMSAIQQNVPDAMLGCIMSFYSAIVNAALPIGILFYGCLYEKFANHLPVIMFLTSATILIVGYIGKKTYRCLQNGKSRLLFRKKKIQKSY
ncbi:MAG: MFS transporter [Lachnospiraceae bacterium]|jgi:hypothetical protein|nr:MFS transporter [Lachnospiraceae bacterium]